MEDYTNGSVLEGDPHYTRIRVYKRRWIMLCIFVICCVSSLTQWFQYSIIANIVVEYYGVSYIAVNWSSMICMLVYIPFIFVGCYVIEKWGLRKAMLIGMLGTCIGSWIKVASISPDGYWIVLVSQGNIGIFGVFLLGAYPKVAAVWFGPHEVSKACSIGMLGSQLGIAIGFLFPPMLFTNTNRDVIEEKLYTLTIAVGVITTIVLIIVFTCFKERPPSPPSTAQLQIQTSTKKMVNFWQSVKILFTNYSYVLLAISYGINVGMFYAISTLLNQIILQYYPEEAVYAGRIGFIIVMCGMLGSVICRIILDSFNRFKLTIMSVHLLCILSLLIFTFALGSDITIVYFISALLGLFMTALLPIGYELAAELAYPVGAGTSGGILTAVAQMFGMAFTYFYSYISNTISEVAANVIMSGLLTVGATFLLFIRFDLQRQKFNSK